jgi:hypothetical protein
MDRRRTANLYISKVVTIANLSVQTNSIKININISISIIISCIGQRGFLFLLSLHSDLSLLFLQRAWMPHVMRHRLRFLRVISYFIIAITTTA